MSRCPYIDWFEFEQQCPIKTCKNNTLMTPSGCIELDRVRPAGAKYISDAELNYYKGVKTASRTDRCISMKRKEAVENVKSILVLWHFLMYIQEKYGKHEKFCSAVVTPTMVELEKEYPLNIQDLHFKNWMWHYLLNEEVLEEFKKTCIIEVTIGSLLGIPQTKADNLISTYKETRGKL